MSESAPKAVFLSYASQDKEVAHKIRDALRAAGVEVWFDQSELRGGDAWDALIRKRIKECTLFVPLITATTNARAEGYFRLEWKLAVDRSHLMADDAPFLFPIVVGDVTDATARVPEKFRDVQWTRLRLDETPAELGARVAKLLSGEGADDGRPGPAGGSGRSRRDAQPAWLRYGWAAVGLIFALVFGIRPLFQESRRSESRSKPRPAAATPAAPAAVAEAKPTEATAAPKPARLADKSIAVLPFTNMSDDKDSGYFADGVHEDVLTNLALVRELRVVSRTSVQAYRGTTKSMRQIAEELGVTYILEGSVRRSGNKVRVTGQLIHAATDEHVWAQSYDRDLTDIFAIQAGLAQQIARALSAALSPEEKARLEHPSVANPAAYDLLLKARKIDQDGNDTRQELETEEALLQNAVALDPRYAAAWAALGALHSQIMFNNVDTSEARLAKAQAAIDMARQLDPDGFEVILGAGTFYYYGLRDYPRALEQLGRITRQWPNNSLGHFVTGLILRRQGKWVESLASLRHAKELDPGSAENARNLVVSYVAMRRYPEAIAEQENRVRLLPESLRESFEVARLKFFQDGSTKPGDELLAGPIAQRASPMVAAGYRKLWAAMKGDLATVARLNRDFPDAWAPNLAAGGGSPAEYAWNNAAVLAALGDLAGARRLLEKFPPELRARLVNEPRNPLVWGQLAHIEALLGNPAEALAAAQRSRELLPETLDPLTGRAPRLAQAFVLAWNGDKPAACAELRQLLATSGQPNVHWLKNGPWFAPLKGDPDFEALLADPGNNAPLL